MPTTTSSNPSSFRVRYVDRGDGNDRRLPVLLSPTHHDRASRNPVLLAVTNALLLRNDVSLPSYGADTVSIDDVTALLANRAFELGNEGAALRLFEELPGLVQDGLEVPTPLLSGGGEIGDLSVVFEAVGLDVVHGCLVCPETVSVESQERIRGKTTSELKLDVFNHMLQARGSLATFHEYLGGSVSENHDDGDGIHNMREALDKAEEQLALAMSTMQDECLGDAQNALSSADRCATVAEEVESYLRTSHFISSYGLRILQESVPNDQICVLYHDKQFFTLTNWPGRGLLTLVTDVKYASDDKTLWERLDKVLWERDDKSHGARQLPDEHSRSGDAAGGENSQQQQQEEPLSDLELAMRLQNEDINAFAGHEEAQLKAALAASLRESGGAKPTAEINDGNQETRVGTKIWNVELAVALEVRAKHAMDTYMTTETYDLQSWEVWSRGANDIRAHPGNIRCEADLPFGLDDGIMFECGRIIRGVEKVVPADMLEAATDIVIEERLMRQEEHQFLVGLVSGTTETDMTSTDLEFPEGASADRRNEQAGPSPDPIVEKSAFRLQASWHGYTTRRDLKRQVEAITRVQAVCRGLSGRAQYRAMKKQKAATRIAAVVRVFLARRRCRLIISSATRLNAVARGRLARKRHLASIKAGLEEWKRVTAQWMAVKVCVQKALALEADVFSWSQLKRDNFDISQADEEEVYHDLDSTSRRITAAYNAVSSEADIEDTQDIGTSTENKAPSVATPVQPTLSSEGGNTAEAYDNIMLTHSVLKWFKNSDPKYKEFFRRRMRQLAAGERSRILQKHLTGCQHTIFETYLDQASAQRIIWTECRDKGSNEKSGSSSILVWYVSKHKWVSRYIKQIDEAEARMNRQFSSSAAHLFEDEKGAGEESEKGKMVIDSETVLLDPMANVPLKIHQMAVSDIDKLEKEAWTPPLRLTEAEKLVVQKPGTVLVLGRSGTGKTVCICNRMVCDAEFHRGAATLRQLFIARSHRIKNLVQSLVKEELDVETSCVERQFLSYERVIRECDAAFDRIGIPSSLHIGSKGGSQSYRDFEDFKSHFFGGIAKEMKLPPTLSVLVIWTQIRSYIKGSIDAVKLDRPLTRDEYLDLGKNRCRLDASQRDKAYAVYERYSQWLQSNNFYDACDRTADLLSRFRRTSIEDRAHVNINYDRIYVDEVQDFTNSDIALFWKLCEGGGSLFLAGDTAQSVEQGIDFRFDEVRSICHYLGGGIRRNVPEKPLSVTLNFRSHAGVLDVAAALLKILHDAFPGSANKLPDDVGLFKGPRPCLLTQSNEKYLGIHALKEVMLKNPGLVLLTPDENVEFLKNSLASCENTIILGICEAKGLDFDEVGLVDFFSTSTKQQGKAWKKFLSTSNSKSLNKQRNAWEVSQYPELEMRVKLLYTGITRCRHRLFFVETQISSAGDAFSRWLLGTKLAEKQDIADLTLQLKSPDEWRSLGVDYALNAESQDATECGAAAWFERAAACFQQGGDSHLASMARSHSLIRTKANELYQEHWEQFSNTSPQLVELCFKEGGFIEEAIEICETILDRCPPTSKKVEVIVEPLLEEMKSVLSCRTARE